MDWGICKLTGSRSTHNTTRVRTHRKERRLELIRDDWGPQQRALARAGGGGGGGGGIGRGGGPGGGAGGQKKAIDLLAPLGPAPAGGGGGGGAAGGGRKGPVRKLDEAGLRTALFRLYEERGAWRLKELLARTGQVEAELKQVLRGIADNQITGGAWRGVVWCGMGDVGGWWWG